MRRLNFFPDALDLVALEQCVDGVDQRVAQQTGQRSAKTLQLLGEVLVDRCSDVGRFVEPGDQARGQLLTDVVVVRSALLVST